MSKKCEVCGKGPLFGKSVSHSHKKTLKTRKANIQNIKIIKGGKVQKANICTRCIKSNKITKA